VLPAAHMFVDLRLLQSFGQVGTEQEVVEPQPGVASLPEKDRRVVKRQRCNMDNGDMSSELDRRKPMGRAMIDRPPIVEPFLPDVRSGCRARSNCFASRASGAGKASWKMMKSIGAFSIAPAKQDGKAGILDAVSPENGQPQEP
jgi:hypothetical protein